MTHGDINSYIIELAGSLKKQYSEEKQFSDIIL